MTNQQHYEKSDARTIVKAFALYMVTVEASQALDRYESDVVNLEQFIEEACNEWLQLEFTKSNEL